MSLREFRDTLLRLDHPEAVLKMADEYLQEYERKGDRFILPKEHKLVLPAIEYYGNNLVGWVEFVKGVRDRLPLIGRQYHEGVQAFYRTLVVRLTQVQRRERLDAAVAMAIKKKFIEDVPDVKMAYSRRCTQVWKQRRDQLLKVHASSTGKQRLSVEEREQLLDEFWAGVTEEISNGELPKP